MPEAEGLTFEFESPNSIRIDVLETLPYKGAKQHVTYKTKEFSCVCPFSGLPDFGGLNITYIPNAKIVELKSLKYYLTSLRNVGIYQEDVTNRIFQDLYHLLDPQYFKITTIYNTRGGIDTTCSIEEGFL